jgi:hypothetical protein
MSRISQDFINSVGYLYEEINIQQEDFLNEDSQYYDAEAAEIVEDILSTISTSMVYEGYSAEGIIGFLADSSEETIIEKYLSFDESILTENVVSEDYIQEQLELFDVAIDEGLADKLLGGAIKLAGRIASKPARKKVANIIQNSKRPEVARRRIQNLAQREARKGNVGGYSPTKSPIDGGKPMTGKQSAELLSKAKLSQATQKVKDIAKGAKAALTSPTAKKIALGAAGLGAAGLAGGIGGYMGAKLAGAGSGSKPTETSRPAEAPVAPKPPAAPSGSGGAGGAGTRTPGTPAKPKPTQGNAQYRELIKKGKTKEAEKLGKEQWAKNFPELAKNLKPDGSQKGTGESEMEKSAEELRKMQNTSKQRQGALMGGPEGPGKIDTKAVEDALKAEQERQQKKLEQQNKTPVTAKESYEPYDIVLNYLLSEGHADTLEEANYIMLEMDENAICTIVEQYNDYLLAEEIQEWVNNLVDEGYDLSQYTWDDMVEYYVTQN